MVWKMKQNWYSKRATQALKTLPMSFFWKITYKSCRGKPSYWDAPKADEIRQSYWVNFHGKEQGVVRDDLMEGKSVSKAPFFSKFFLALQFQNSFSLLGTMVFPMLPEMCLWVSNDRIKMRTLKHFKIIVQQTLLMDLVWVVDVWPLISMHGVI